MPAAKKKRRISTAPAGHSYRVAKKPVGKLTEKDAKRGRKSAKTVEKRKPQYERLYLGKNQKYDPTPQKCECRRPWIDQEDGDRCNYCGKALDRLAL